MSSPRHHAREIALQILYRYDSTEQSDGQAPPQGADLARELAQHFSHFAVSEDLREFAAELVAGTLAKRGELDEKIEKQAANWKMSRMPLVDRSILRLALYEMMFGAASSTPAVPPQVVIEEAVELAKQFGEAETPAFVNGILDALRRLPSDPAAD